MKYCYLCKGVHCFCIVLSETDVPGETVRTGDDTQIGKYILVLAVSGLMIGLLVFFKKRKKEDEES